MYYLYFLTDTNTNSFYVGITGFPEKRIQRHRNDMKRGTHHNTKVQELFDGGANFESIFYIFNTMEEAYTIEQKVILANQDNPLMLNINVGNNNLKLNPRRQEIKDKISKRLKEKWAGYSREELKEKFGRYGTSNGMFGKRHTEEAKRKMGLANVGRAPANKGEKMSLEQHAKLMEHVNARDYSGKNNPFFNKSHTRETRAKISNAAKGRVSSRRLPVMINGSRFNSLSDAHKVLGIPLVTIRHRCLSENKKFNSWSFIKA